MRLDTVFAFILLVLAPLSFCAPSCSDFALDCEACTMSVAPDCSWCDTGGGSGSCMTAALCPAGCSVVHGDCRTNAAFCEIPNSPPTIGVVTILPSPVLVGGDLVCRATVSDVDGDECTVTFKAWDSGSSEGSPDHSDIMFCSGASWLAGKICESDSGLNNFQLPGPVTCKIYADDGHGGTDSESGTANLQCQLAYTQCGNFCYDLQTNPLHCGSCDNICVDKDCISGVCGCAVGQTSCAGVGCKNLQTDSSNCGTCGNICPGTSTCQSGVCTCPNQQTLCGSVCLDTTSNMLNCGTCGNVCDDNEICNIGVCEEQTSCQINLDCNTGWACCNRICARPTCNANSECEDNNACTVDTCISAGTCEAFCRHAAMASCINDDGCCPTGCTTSTDSDCVTACPSYCSGDVPGTQCEQYVCFGSTCFKSYKKPCCGNEICETGETSSTCGVDCPSTCGNGVCDATEGKCICPGECGACAGKCSETCMEQQCQPEGCVCFPISNCCGNGNCDSNETFANCAQDCAPRTVSISILAPLSSDSFMRGDSMNLTANVTADGIPAINASVSVSAFSAVYILYDDGMHGDGNQYDGVYSNAILVPTGAPDGMNTLSFSAMKKRKKGSASTIANIDASLDLSLSAAKNYYQLGDNVELTGELSKKGVLLNRNVVLSITAGGSEIYSATVSSAGGQFSYTYRITLADAPGTWLITASASDEQGNAGLASKQIIVGEPSDTGFFTIESAEPKPGAYARGQQISITILLKHEGAPVTDATVSFTAPDGKAIPMQDVGGGVYSMPYQIGWGDPVGAWKISIKALKVTQDGTQAGGAESSITITPAMINIELIEPSKNTFSIGESVPVIIRATYPDGTPAELPMAAISVMGGAIPMTQKSRGVYEGSFKITEDTPPDLLVSLDIGDVNGNMGQKKLSVKVEGTSPLYYAEKYPLFAIILFLFLAGVVFTIGRAVYKSERLRRLEARQKGLIELQKKLQIQYFKEGTLDKETFYDLSSKYDAELENIEKMLAAFGPKKK